MCQPRRSATRLSPQRAGKLILWAPNGRYGVGSRLLTLEALSADDPNDPLNERNPHQDRDPEEIAVGQPVINYTLFYKAQYKEISKNAPEEITKQLGEEAVQQHDLITVQSRHGHPNLSTLWMALRLRNITYECIHCCFCRVPISVSDQPPKRVGLPNQIKHEVEVI